MELQIKENHKLITGITGIPATAGSRPMELSDLSTSPHADGDAEAKVAVNAAMEEARAFMAEQEKIAEKAHAEAEQLGVEFEVSTISTLKPNHLNSKT